MTSPRRDSGATPLSSREERRLAYYSVSGHGSIQRADILDKLCHSAASLRRFNPTLDIYVLAYQPLPDRIIRKLSAAGVNVDDQLSYETLVGRADPIRCDILTLHPALHRFLNLRYFEKFDPEQILFLDVDTLVFRNLDQLFQSHTDRECFAREETGSRRHLGGYCPGLMVNEEELHSLVQREGISWVPPFNCGVILFNSLAWRALAQLPEVLLQYAWNFTLWMALNPAEPEAGFSEAAGVEYLRRRYPQTLTAERDQALQLPTNNRWLMDEIALWLTLGRIQDFSYADFLSSEVSQSTEVFADRERQPDFIGHYFNQGYQQARKFIEPQSTSVASVGTRPILQGVGMGDLVPDFVLSSNLMTKRQGFAIYQDLIDPDTLEGLRFEAMSAYWTSQLQVEVLDARGDGRGGHPRQRRAWGNGGVVQTDLYHAEWLREFLCAVTGLDVRPTGQRGGFAYYTRGGDHVGLHLDVDGCDLVLIIALFENSNPDAPEGALVIYPDRHNEPLSRIRMDSTRGAIPLKLQVGQAIVMLGGVVPHFVAPSSEGQARVMSVMCFTVSERVAH